LVQPIWQVLADLGIEGEHCQNAADAVERVSTQLFQIVITDWEDQPEAGLLLKTAREIKAAKRPLTLAIVGADASLQEALQAGANSVLTKPLRAEQARDTISTACELLRSRLQPGAPRAQSPAPKPSAMAGTAAASGAFPAAVAPMKQIPGPAFRAGEFLQTPRSTPAGPFDTDSDIHRSMEHAAAPGTVDALADLEPMASAIEDAPANAAKPRRPVTGWASLQSQLTKPIPYRTGDSTTKNELLTYAETFSYGASAAGETEGGKADTRQRQTEAAPELVASRAQESKAGTELEPKSAKKRSGVFVLAGLAVASVGVVAVPGVRQGLPTLYQSAVHSTRSWLNPQPAAVPQTVTQHESFGQAGDEYKLPAAANIPDATTDPSQIRVLPVVDPTAKPAKGSDANGGQAPASATDGDSNASQGAVQTGQARGAEGENKDLNRSSAGDTGSVSGIMPAASASGTLAQPNAGTTAAPTPLRQLPATAPKTALHPASAGNDAPIPSSLKSQMASMTPDASGAKPAEAAMSSIEPVILPESAVRELLAQPVAPEYPAAAKASGQRGSVVLQVLIGRDGTVQEAKFLQGSFMFARAAIDAVKQWSFKPYLLNGRAVSVQGAITLNFKPPA
jgi:protein TonB